jgi:hypothetical protein
MRKITEEKNSKLALGKEDNKGDVVQVTYDLVAMFCEEAVTANRLDSFSARYAGRPLL